MTKKEKAKPGFQAEPTELRSVILDRGHIEPWELLRICAWKSAKGLAWLTLNTEEEIRNYTRETIAVLKASGGATDVLNGNLNEADWAVWEAKAGELVGADAKHGGPSGLHRLHGVGYPVATAILGFLAPATFPVMDKWAVETIFGSGASKKRWQRKAAYRAYAERLVNPKCAALEAISSLRDRDKAAMEAAMAGKKIKGLKEISLPKSLKPAVVIELP
jgi:hypothetical protein